MNRVNVEALRLYRDILRACRHVTWNNEKGEPWAEILKRSARIEFEQARDERDPLLVARMIVVARHSLEQFQQKFTETANQIKDNVEKTRNPNA